MPDVRIERVSKRFGELTALDEVSLDVRHGEFFCVLGHPGAGKTTLLRTIAGLETPEAGRIRIGERDVTAEPPGERDVALVFQNLALYPDKTVFGNLAFPLRQQRRPKREIRATVMETARLLDIEPLLKRKPGQLSGGERQRVAIGRALVRAPALSLFDEPLSALDALLRLRMRTELKHLQRDLGRTLVYVTHDQVEAMSMADRICVLDGGRVQQIAPPIEVYTRPANVAVALAVGTPQINLIDATVAAGASAVTLRATDFALEVTSGAAVRELEPYDGQAVRLGVRPEDVLLAPLDRPAVADGVVVAIEPLGGEIIVDLHLGGQLVKASTMPGARFAVDEVVPVAFETGRLQVFGPDGAAVTHGLADADAARSAVVA